jgi:putative Mg2+ transporter-C (MgtC) family protein
MIGRTAMTFGEPMGQGWEQIGELALAFVLSALIGLEREIRQKSAGLRTYTLVGFASALFLLVSKYGFTDILSSDRIVLDPSRIAAQIVSGIGFIGGGIIFVRRDAVRGLTTAASVWLTAAVGMACGAGLPILAVCTVAGNFLIIFTFPLLVNKLPKSRWTPSRLEISYLDGHGILREVLVTCTQEAFAVSRVRVERTPGATPPQAAETAAEEMANDAARGRHGRIVTVYLEVQGVRSVAGLAAELSHIKGVVSVKAGDVNVVPD